MYALTLDADGRILSATPAKYAQPGAIVVDSLPTGDVTAYRYADGAFVHDPLPEPEQPETGPTAEDRLTALEAKLSAYETAYQEGVQSA